jgi:hypothetical protein
MSQFNDIPGYTESSTVADPPIYIREEVQGGSPPAEMIHEKNPHTERESIGVYDPMIVDKVKVKIIGR